ncbi:MAG: phosphatidylglycerophosphatase A [Desulfobacteraceae bacterium]|nr:MAG: phosphatidylglycerophosphatase A [Desulfobacteraceae bacterium]
MNFREKLVMFLATGLFVGNIPVAPGTFGTIAGLLFCLFLSRAGFLLAFIIVVVFIVFAMLIAGKAEKIIKRKDPGCIVIDEIAGIMITFLGLPFNFISVISGFFIFRILDIIKPFPIRSIENRLSGGAGIVMDDVAAGFLGNCILRAIFAVTGFM